MPRSLIVCLLVEDNSVVEESTWSRCAKPGGNTGVETFELHFAVNGVM